ncbi:unnamed protein product [Dicrocoelium dendriticum]|nr:unnamed protein product [Dicrocoelium dendriticum]
MQSSAAPNHTSEYVHRKRSWTDREAICRPNAHDAGLHLTESTLLNTMNTMDVPFPPLKRVANERERTRTASVNDAFLMLRSLIPTEPMNRKLSKIETLRLASSYISHLHAVLVTGTDPAEQPCLRHQQLPPSGCAFGRCPIGTPDRRTSGGKEQQQQRPVCTFCVTEMKQQQKQQQQQQQQQRTMSELHRETTFS